MFTVAYNHGSAAIVPLSPHGDGKGPPLSLLALASLP